MSHNHTHTMSEKLYKLLEWITDPYSRGALILYGPRGSGKSRVLEEAITWLKSRNHHDRHVPETITQFKKGNSEIVYTVPEFHRHMYKLLKGKTILIVTSHEIPDEMPHLLHADTLKFDRD